MDVGGKVVLVTGASMGIGRATALAFARAGARLALAARSADALERLAEEIRAGGGRAEVIPADLLDAGQVRAVVGETWRRYGRIDVLINNAGQAAAGAVADVSPDDFRTILDLNVFAPLHAMQAAIPLMREVGGGMIINVSSMVSKMTIPGLAAYTATKAALNAITDAARLELAPEGITVINIFPRLTATEFGQRSLGNRTMHHEQRRGMDIPIDTPEHVADRILQAAIEGRAEQYMTD